VKHSSRMFGFTLLELLISLSILVGIIAVVLMSFEGGFRVYARIRDFGNREAEVYFAGEMLEQDLGYLIPAAPYRFHARELRFVREPLYGEEWQEIHVLAPVSGGLTYSVRDHNTGGMEHSGISLVRNDLDVSFSFASPEDGDTWLLDWGTETNIPLAVRMTVQGVYLGEENLIERTMVLTSTVGEEEE